MGRVLSLYLPRLAIDRLHRRWRRQVADNNSAGGRSGPPAVVLVQSERGRQVVVQACGRSERAGVKAGMSLAHARALLPADVVVQPTEPARDAAALEALARWALRFTPIVQVDPPAGLLLEITGCEHLFGGVRAMLGKVVGQAGRLGVQASGAIGPTVGSAWALARFGGGHGRIVESLDEVAEALGRMPVRALRIEAEVEQALSMVSVETVAQVRALPRASLAERFGESLLLRLDQALGQAFEPVTPVRPSEPVEVERLFAGPVKQLEAILLTGRALVEALCEELARREAGVRQLQVHLRRIDAHDLYETLTLSRPSRDARHLWALLRPRLEQVHLGHGIEQVTLHAAATARLPHQQTGPAGWEPQTQTQHEAWTREVGELVDQLVSRFGPERVSRAEVQASHVPERACVDRPVGDGGATGDRAQPAEPEVVAADRPMRLYDRAEPVQVMLLAPEGPVMTLRRAGEVCRIVTSLGPERITPRWWLVGTERDKPAPRDYFKVQDEHGRWWWLYRQAGTSNWFVHGRWC